MQSKGLYPCQSTIWEQRFDHIIHAHANRFFGGLIHEIAVVMYCGVFEYFQGMLWDCYTMISRCERMSTHSSHINWAHPIRNWHIVTAAYT
jgi:hypothetical protein